MHSTRANKVLLQCKIWTILRRMHCILETRNFYLALVILFSLDLFLVLKKNHMGLLWQLRRMDHQAQ